MSTVSADKTNRLLIVIALLSVTGMLVLFYLVYLQHPNTPPPVDIAPLKKELNDIRAANSDLAAALQKITQADPSKDKAAKNQADAQVKALTAEIGKLTTLFDKRIEDLQKQQKEAVEKGDSALAEQVKKSLDQQREQMEAFKKQMEKYKDDVAKAAEKGAAVPPPPQITPLPNEDKSEQGQEIVNNIVRIGLFGLCLSFPELAPILTAIASEMGLFGNTDPEVRLAYMQAVQDVAAGRPISPETRKRLAEAGRDGKIPEKMVGHLDGILKLLPGGALVKKAFDENTWKGLKPRTGGGLVDDLARRLREKPTKEDLDDLRKMFPTAGGEPYYPSKSDKEKVEKLFDNEYSQRKAELWDGPKGLGKITVKE